MIVRYRKPTPPTMVSAVVALVRYLIGQVPDQETDVWPIDECPLPNPSRQAAGRARPCGRTSTGGAVLSSVPSSKRIRPLHSRHQPCS